MSMFRRRLMTSICKKKDVYPENLIWYLNGKDGLTDSLWKARVGNDLMFNTKPTHSGDYFSINRNTASLTENLPEVSNLTIAFLLKGGDMAESDFISLSDVRYPNIRTFFSHMPYGGSLYFDANPQNNNDYKQGRIDGSMSTLFGNTFTTDFNVVVFRRGGTFHEVEVIGRNKINASNKLNWESHIMTNGGGNTALFRNWSGDVKAILGFNTLATNEEITNILNMG